MNRTIEFAKVELEKYLSNLGVEAEISLGLFDDYSIKMNLGDFAKDDAIAISVKNRKGYIAGSNERKGIRTKGRSLKSLSEVFMGGA